MQEVETHLSETSRRCNTTLFEKSNSNAIQLKSETQREDRRRFTVASQLSVFRKCPEVLARTLRRDWSVLLAAKVLIISRLLHKQLSTNSEVANFVDTTWSRLGRLRQKLLATVDRRLANSSLQAARLVDAMCAYALATSTSSSLDILRHFHHVRLKAISTKLRRGATDHQSILEALRIWIRTLQETRTIFPKQLTNALAKLRSGPLLIDESVQSVSEFDFDVHVRWLGEEVGNFVPYVRRDDMSISDASKQLSTWAPTALKALLSNLKGCLEAVTSLTEVIDLRKSCLELLFSHYHIAGVRRNGVLNGFRDAFEERLLGIVRQRCQGLSEISNDVSDILEEWDVHKTGEAYSGLWISSTTSMSILHGAKDLKETLITTLNGRTNTVRMVSDHYQSWLSNIEEIDRVIAAMRNTRWEDHLDDLSDESDSDEEEEATLSRIKILLKETDPASIGDSLSTELECTYQALQSRFDSIASNLRKDSSIQGKCAFLIRVLRDIKQRRPTAYKQNRLEFNCISELHSNLASPSIRSVVDRHSNAIAKTLRRKSPSGRVMWDGSPELPVLPSPWSFRFLKDLEQELSTIGTDVWTPSAKTQMKKLLREKLAEILYDAMEKFKSTRRVNGVQEAAHDSNSIEKDEKEEGQEERNGVEDVPIDEQKISHLPSQDTTTQQLFDIEYIHAVSSANDEEGVDHKLESFRSWLRKKADLDAKAVDRLRSSAEAYRKRTAFLFALAN